MPDLSDRFAEEQSNVIDLGGVPTYGLYEFDEIPSHLTLEFISAKDTPPQGVQLRMRGGTMTVNDIESDDIVLWQDTAPSRVEIEIRSKPRGRTTLKLWNVWRAGHDVTQAWLGNAAIQIEAGSSGRVVLRCSDGQGGPSFDDLVVAVTPHWLKPCAGLYRRSRVAAAGGWLAGHLGRPSPSAVVRALRG